MDHYQIIALSLFALYLAEVSGQEQAAFKCPDKTGYYPDPVQCDLYYRCVGGQPEEKLCPDGLLFDDSNPSHERCDTPVNVDCGDRNQLQEPKPTKGCPRANGFFRHPDPLVCDKFVNCIEGVVNELPCPPGLIYDDGASTCSWPVESTRLDCTKSKKQVLDDGFSCPDGETMGPNGRILPHPTFPHPENCQKFYICRNGVIPQHGSCSAGFVYNEETFKCDDPENVPGCVGGVRQRRSRNHMERTILLSRNYYVPHGGGGVGRGRGPAHSTRPLDLPGFGLGPGPGPGYDDRLLDDDYYADDFFRSFDYPDLHIKSDVFTHAFYDDGTGGKESELGGEYDDELSSNRSKTDKAHGDRADKQEHPQGGDSDDDDKKGSEGKGAAEPTGKGSSQSGAGS